MTRFLPSVVAALTLIACGGAFDGGGDDDDDTGGQAGSGGQGAQGGSTSKGGSSGKGGSGASAGTGSGGSSGGGCEWQGSYYQVGDSFPAGDGCNTCSCGSNGSVGCTEAECNMCSDLETAYAAAIEEGKTCDPQEPAACTQQMWGGLPCGCPTFLNADQVDAIATAEQALDDYTGQGCGGTVLCAPCLAPIGATCSAEGRCADTFDVPGAACEVDGTVYPSGSSGVPDAFSCNTCDCVNGELTGCTEALCPVACPPDSVPSSQCSQCGPVDNCEVVEHACLPVCTGTCEAGGACLDGVCRMVCG